MLYLIENAAEQGQTNAWNLIGTPHDRYVKFNARPKIFHYFESIYKYDGQGTCYLYYNIFLVVSILNFIFSYRWPIRSYRI